MNYIKQKRGKYGLCNICGKAADLTYDHVPPKAALFNEVNVLANTIFEGLPTENSHMHHFQNGIKYRTICADCNNVVLGRNDEYYKRFIEDVVQALNRYLELSRQGIYPGDTITVSTKINRVLRAICGHFLAMKQEYDDQVLVDKALRDYVFDESLTFKDYYLQCWFYRYSTIVNARDFVARGRYEKTHPNSMVSIMNAFPLAITLTTEDSSSCWLDDLSKHSTNNIDDSVDVTLNLVTQYVSGCKARKHFAWPVYVSDSDDQGALFVLGNGELMEGSRLGVRR